MSAYAASKNLGSSHKNFFKMKKMFFIVAATITGSTQLWAQTADSTKTKQLDAVVVTATKADLKQSQTGKVITVIDQATIRNNAGRSVSELLNSQAGFFINGANNTPGTNLDLYFRGASNGNMLIVIDGVPVFDPSQPNNTFDLNNIPLDQIEKIEILKGGQSTIWGSDAVAGVIQIFLKKDNKKPLVANGSLAYGSYNTWKAGVGFGGRSGKLGYNVQYNYNSSDGITSAHDSVGGKGFDKDGFRQNSVIADLTYYASDRLTVRAFGNFSKYHNDVDEGAFTDDKDYTAKNANEVGGLNLRYHYKGVVLNFLGSYQHVDRSFVDDSTDISSPYSNYSRGKYIGNTTTVEGYGTFRIADNVQLVGGIQYIHQNTDQSYLSIGMYGPYSSDLSKDSAEIRQVSAYASLLYTGTNGFNLEAGGRYNNHSIYGNNATYTFNPSYNINQQLKLFLNISSAYKIPSLYQLYSEYGNKKLNPENSTTYEFGLQIQNEKKSAYIRLVGFKRDIKNLIIFYSDPVTYASYYINRDKQNDYGVELESELAFGKKLKWTNNVGYVDGKGTQDDVKISNLYRRPKFTWNSSLNINLSEKFVVIPSVRVIGSRLKGPYDIGPEKQPSYYTLDCFAAYDCKKDIRLFLDLRNITNQEYFDIVGYDSKQFNLMAGINFKF
ncbi:MAG: hypothetical protein C5B52_01540 [Bacteroidetes bacterium]|nr:MAG: hypothetical protein C5B52_01540 [Bacteroidota bacterium]